SSVAVALERLVRSLAVGRRAAALQMILHVGSTRADRADRLLELVLGHVELARPFTPRLFTVDVDVLALLAAGIVCHGEPPLWFVHTGMATRVPRRGDFGRPASPAGGRSTS